MSSPFPLRFPHLRFGPMVRRRIARAKEFLPDAFLLVGGAVLTVGLSWLFTTKRVFLYPANYKVERTDVEMPAFTGTGMNGEAFSSLDLKGPTVLVFWASWCQFCQQEVPKLDEFGKKFPDLKFIGVVFRDTQENIGNFVKLNEVKYPSYFVDKSVAKAFGVDSVPQFFVVDSSHHIKLHFRGTKFTENAQVMKLLGKVS